MPRYQHISHNNASIRSIEYTNRAYKTQQMLSMLSKHPVCLTIFFERFFESNFFHSRVGILFYLSPYSLYKTNYLFLFSRIEIHTLFMFIYVLVFAFFLIEPQNRFFRCFQLPRTVLTR